MILLKASRIFTLAMLMIFSLQVISQADYVETLVVPYDEVLKWPEEFSVHFDYGIGTMSNSFADEVENLSVSNGHAFNIGIAWVHHYKGPAFFRMELMVMAIQSKETMKAFSYTTDSGTVITYQDGEVHKSVTYLSLPIIYGLELSRFYLGAGLQVGLMVSGNGYTVNHEIYVKRRVPERVYADFEAGFRVLTGLRFAKHFYTEVSYYHGLNNICSGKMDTNGQTWKARQLTFGIRYSFHYYKPYPKIDIFDIENLD